MPYRKLKKFAGFLWYLVTYLGFLLWCNIRTYPGDNKVATVYRRSSNKNGLKINQKVCKIVIDILSPEFLWFI